MAKINFLKKWFPVKGDSKGEIIRKIVFLISFSVLIFSAVLLIMEYLQQKNDEALMERLRSSKNVSISLPVETTPPENGIPVVQERFKELLEINSDLIGWVKLDNSPIDYPVVKGQDNDFYLDHAFDKSESKFGTVFADYREEFSPTNQPHNMILYGHNVYNGTYFASLAEYYHSRKTMDYYKEHPIVEFDTLYENSKYKIFAGMYVNVDEADGEVFYYLNGRNFNSKAEFDEYFGKVFDRTAFFTDVGVEYGDEILTLSTCINVNSGLDLRWVIFARKLRNGESEEVDLSKAVQNPDPLYFDRHYEIHGGSWGGRKWDSSLIGS